MGIKTTIIISILAHTAILGSFQDRLEGLFEKDGRGTAQVTVDYVFTKAGRAPSRNAAPSSVKADSSRPAYNVVKPGPGHEKAAAVKGAERVIVTAVKPPPAAAKHAAIEKRIKSTHEYVDYYQTIREMIRRSLIKNYSSYYREGGVRVVFTVSRTGACDSVEIDGAKSSNDAMLRKIAIDSVRGASPYPQFPKEFNLPVLSFDLQITFKKDSDF